MIKYIIFTTCSLTNNLGKAKTIVEMEYLIQYETVGCLLKVSVGLIRNLITK